MSTKVPRFHPEAEQEYLAALGWYRQRSLSAATNFEATMRRATSRIAASPKTWPVYFDEFRKYTLRQFPFSLIYQDFPSEVVAFAVAHGKRRPDYWKDRK